MMHELESWLMSDCPYHDLTTEGLGIEEVPTRLEARVKARTVVAGVMLAKALFEKEGCRVTLHAKDGDTLEAGSLVMTVEALAQRIHKTYKMAQCVMEYASGIASYTRSMVDGAKAINPLVSISGTRKMMPGSKTIAYAGLLAGGGVVHRYGLSDSILVFDQHRVLCGEQADIDARVRRLVALHPERKVAIEVASLEEALHYASLGVGIIQCEKFTVESLHEAVKALKEAYPHVTILAAGGVNADNAPDYAKTGVDVLVSSRMYFARPMDVKMQFSRLR